MILTAAFYSGVGLFSADFITRPFSMRLFHFMMLLMVFSAIWTQYFWWKVICIGICLGNYAIIGGNLIGLVNESTISISKLRKNINPLLCISMGCSSILMS